MVYNGVNEETAEIIRKINLLKTAKNDFVRLGYYVIRKDQWGVSEHTFLEETGYRDFRFTYDLLTRIMHLYPQIFFIDCGLTHIYFDWTRIPQKAKENLHRAGKMGFITMGYRRTTANMVEEIPLGINAGPALETLWAGPEPPRRKIQERTTTSIRTPVHREQDNHD
jgi:hypothetical protein